MLISAPESSSETGDSGFGLVEALASLVLVGAVAGLAAQQAGGSLDAARRMAARAAEEQLARTLAVSGAVGRGETAGLVWQVRTGPAGTTRTIEVAGPGNTQLEVTVIDAPR